MGDYDAITVAGAPLTAPEKYVLEQVEAGDEALFLFGEYEERELRAAFLEDLLTGQWPEVKVHHRGVRIKGAVITGDLNLDDAEVPYAVALEHSSVLGSAGFQEAHFHKSVLFFKAEFASTINFYRARIEAAFSCQQATFQGAVDFRRADLQGGFSASCARFESKTKADFNGMKVGQSASFREAAFQGPVDFAGADIGGQFAAKRAQFTSREKATARSRLLSTP